MYVVRAVTLGVIEATGRYERRCAVERMAAGYEVAVINPRLPRDFAKATGRLAKTELNTMVRNNEEWRATCEKTNEENLLQSA